jgi:hypothetical protein
MSNPESNALRVPARLTALLAVLVATCATAGVAVSRFYRHVPPILLPGTYGQDWTSMAILAALAWAVHAARRGAAGGLVVWAGLLGYYAYGYALYAFGPQYTALHPFYAAILGLASFSLILLGPHLRRVVPTGILRRRLPVGPIVALFAGIVLLLAPVWLAMMFAAIRDAAPSPFSAVHTLDLAFVFPAMILAAIGLSKRRAWGYVLAGPLLVLTTAMMASLVVSELIAVGQAVADLPYLSLAFASIGGVAMVLTRRYLQPLDAAHLPLETTERVA